VKNCQKCCSTHFFLHNLMLSILRGKKLPKNLGTLCNFQKNCPKKIIAQHVKIPPIRSLRFQHNTMYLANTCSGHLTAEWDVRMGSNKVNNISIFSTFCHSTFRTSSNNVKPLFHVRIPPGYINRLHKIHCFCDILLARNRGIKNCF
jgi:hypothetical protein